jgi:hypothetical protein
MIPEQEFKEYVQKMMSEAIDIIKPPGTIRTRFISWEDVPAGQETMIAWSNTAFGVSVHEVVWPVPQMLSVLSWDTSLNKEYGLLGEGIPYRDAVRGVAYHEVAHILVETCVTHLAVKGERLSREEADAIHELMASTVERVATANARIGKNI